MIALILAFSAFAASPDTSPPAKAATNGAREESSMTLESAARLRDPFKKFIAKQKFTGPKTPELERHNLDEFKLVGIITGPKRSKALLNGPDGKMYIVAINTHIGVRKGIIRKIAPGYISVEERVMNLLGEEEKIESVLEMKDKLKDKENL